MARRLEQKQGEFEFNLLQRICDADTSILLSRDEWPGVDVPHRDEKISKYLNTHCSRPSRICEGMFFISLERVHASFNIEMGA